MTRQQIDGSTPVLENSFRIGEWHVKPAAGLLSRGDKIVHLEPRVMTVLSLLASNAGEVISREQLEAEAWPGVVVGYDALASSILKLRKALGDDSREPRYIVTVSKRGYRLIAPVEYDADSSADTVTQKTGSTGKPAARLRLLALINNQLGNGTEAKRLILKGMQLNPHYSWDYPYNLGRAEYLLGNYKDAIKNLNLALNRNDQAINPRLYLIASLVAVGKKDDAEWEVEKVKIQSPETTLSRMDKDYPVYGKIKQKFFGELQAAGFPE